MALKIKPLEDRVIVEAMAPDEKTASGIILPDTAQEKPQQGTSYDLLLQIQKRLTI